MALETRGKKKYLYQSIRIQGHVRKIYWGTGPLAELKAQEMEDRKTVRAEKRRRKQEAKSKLAPAETAAAALDAVSAVLPFGLAGQNGPQEHPLPQESQPQPVPDPAGSQRVRELLIELQQGDRSHVDELAECLDQQPELWACLGALSEAAKLAWVEQIAGGDLLRIQGIQHELEKMQADFAVGVQDPAARMLIDRILIAWLEVTYVQTRIAEAADCSNDALKILMLRQTGANRRHLAALRLWRQWQQIEPFALHAGVPPAPPSGSPVAKVRTLVNSTERGPCIANSWGASSGKSSD